jgi:hypothetical protein
MMAKFKSLDHLYKYIKKEVNKSLDKDVSRVVKDEMKKVIEEVVYNAYEPSQYDRQKDDGGLLDESNIKHGVENGQLWIRNTRSDEGKDVAEIVETGVGYDWERSRIYKMQPFPRPFHEETKENLEKNKKHVDALKDSLKNKGFDID